MPDREERVINASGRHTYHHSVVEEMLGAVVTDSSGRWADRF